MFSGTSDIGVPWTVVLSFFPIQTHSQGEPTPSPFSNCPSSHPFPSQDFSPLATIISPGVSSGYLGLHMTTRRMPQPLPSSSLEQDCILPQTLESSSVCSFPRRVFPPLACPLSSVYRPFPKCHCFSFLPLLTQLPVTGVNKTYSYLAPLFLLSFSVRLHTAGRILKM